MSFARHEGWIHDHVDIRDEDDAYLGDVAVLAGENERDTVAVMLHFGPLNCVVHLSPVKAMTLGRLLIAAAEDTASRHAESADVGTDEEVAS